MGWSENMKRSVGWIPITYTETEKDEYGNEWDITSQEGTVETNDILELYDGMKKIWVEIKT